MVGGRAAVIMPATNTFLPKGLRESKAKMTFEQMITTRPKRLET